MGHRRRPGYRRLGLAVAALALLALASAGAVLAQGAPYGGGGRVGGEAYEYAAGPYAQPYEGSVYLYATGEDGQGYYATYAEEEWGEWTGWEDQPADY